MRTAAQLGIVLAVIAAAIIAGIAPYAFSSTLRQGAQNGARQATLGERLATEISSAQSPSPTISIAPHASQNGSVSEPFSPPIVNIHVGDTVTWVNHDSVDHNVKTALFDSEQIAPQSSSVNSSNDFKYTFNQKGIYVYFDKQFPFIGGVVYVDTEETQRELVDTTNPSIFNVKVEMPQNAAFQNKYGPYFIPANAIVTVGSRITWENHDFIAHTATSSDRSSFDTGPILPGASKSAVLNHEGIVTYFCEIHPWMSGIVTVTSPK